MSWAVHSKNSLANVSGFSPYQLAIGYTPSLPSILTSKPPAMEDFSSEKRLSEILQGMSAARKAFIECENSERIKRALRHNIRPSSKNKFLTGDTVYYKRNDSKKWKGPGKVIGHDSQQILVKHGSVYVRVHPCRLLLGGTDPINPCENESTQSDTTNKYSPTDDDSDSSDGWNEEQHVREEEIENDDSITQLTSNESGREEESENDDSITAAGTTTVQSRVSTENDQIPEETSSQNVRKGMDVDFKGDNDVWLKGKVLGRAGKAGGKYKSLWNLELSEDKSVIQVDFDKVHDWKTNESILMAFIQ